MSHSPENPEAMRAESIIQPWQIGPNSLIRFKTKSGSTYEIRKATDEEEANAEIPTEFKGNFILTKIETDGTRHVITIGYPLQGNIAINQRLVIGLSVFSPEYYTSELEAISAQGLLPDTITPEAQKIFRKYPLPSSSDPVNSILDTTGGEAAATAPEVGIQNQPTTPPEIPKELIPLTIRKTLAHWLRILFAPVEHPDHKTAEETFDNLSSEELKKIVEIFNIYLTASPSSRWQSVNDVTIRIEGREFKISLIGQYNHWDSIELTEIT